MAVALILVGKTPGQTQFGLDSFTEHYKCAATADAVLLDASVPQKGDAHASYPFMFVTDRHCQESSESASALDLVYTGCMESVSGAPVLPPATQKYSSLVQTASSGITVTGVTTPAVSMQFYAQTSETIFMSYNAAGVIGTAPDPLSDPIVISVTVQDATYAPSSVGIAAFIDAYFAILTTDVIQNQQVVTGGKFWANTELKTKYYGPPLIIVP